MFKYMFFHIFNLPYRNIVGRNMLRVFGHMLRRVATCWVSVGSKLKMVKFEPTTPWHVAAPPKWAAKRATYCAQQYCDMLRWHVAIVLPGLYNGNWTEWSAIWSEIIRVISKSNERAARVWFQITSMISDQNCTTRSSIATLLHPFWNRTI